MKWRSKPMQLLLPEPKGRLANGCCGNFVQVVERIQRSGMKLSGSSNTSGSRDAAKWFITISVCINK